MDETVSIAMLNQYIFCPRRFALMFIEGIWSDNEHTFSGNIVHKHADLPGYETEKKVKILRALPLYSNRYQVSGKSDIVEVKHATYTPVEYKKGKLRNFENDEIQLCAQALCLEEMFSTTIEYGYIFHAESKRRRKVEINQPLRQLAIETIERVRSMLKINQIPTAELRPRCRGCSLRATCLPELSDPKHRTKLTNLSSPTCG